MRHSSFLHHTAHLVTLRICTFAFGCNVIRTPFFSVRSVTEENESPSCLFLDRTCSNVKMTSTSDHWDRLGTQSLPRAEASPTASGALARPMASHQRYETANAGSSDPWTTAYNEAMGQLDDDMRAVVQKGQNLEELFENLSQTNENHKHKSILRRGMDRMQTPLKFLETTLDVAKPLASLDPGSSAAVGLIQSVTTVCAKKDTQRPIQKFITVICLLSTPQECASFSWSSVC